MKLLYFDAKAHLDADPLRDLMLQVLPHPNPEMLDHLLERYRTDDAMQLLAALDDDERLVAVAGMRLEEGARATLLHLRVADGVQRRGIGHAIVRKAIAHFALAGISARCPEELLPFYSSMGFRHWLVGEKPPGHKWYGVRWSALPA
jgi:GNAT superfamily N-acetyltransferase